MFEFSDGLDAFNNGVRSARRFVSQASRDARQAIKDQQRAVRQQQQEEPRGTRTLDEFLATTTGKPMDNMIHPHAQAVAYGQHAMDRYAQHAETLNDAFRDEMDRRASISREIRRMEHEKYLASLKLQESQAEQEGNSKIAR